MVWVVLKCQVYDLKLLKIPFEFLADVHVVFASGPLMALDHNVVLPQDLDIFQKIMVQIIDLMVHVLLEEIDKLIRIPHNFSFAPGLLGPLISGPLER